MVKDITGCTLMMEEPNLTKKKNLRKSLLLPLKLNYLVTINLSQLLHMANTEVADMAKVCIFYVYWQFQ